MLFGASGQKLVKTSDEFTPFHVYFFQLQVFKSWKCVQLTGFYKLLLLALYFFKQNRQVRKQVFEIKYLFNPKKPGGKTSVRRSSAIFEWVKFSTSKFHDLKCIHNYNSVFVFCIFFDWLNFYYFFSAEVILKISWKKVMKS